MREHVGSYDELLAQEGLRIAGKYAFTERSYVKDPRKWSSFLYVYSECYSKNDRILWEIPDGSDLCKAVLVEEGDFYYLFYRDIDGSMNPIVFTHKRHVSNTSALDTIPAWWN